MGPTVDSAIQAAAAAFALLFGAASLAKLDGWRAWSRTVFRLASRRRRLARSTRVTIPALEVAAVAALFVAPASGLAYASALLFVFAGGVALLARRDKEGEDCGCFGALMPARIEHGLAIRDACLATAAGALAIVAFRASVDMFRPLEILLVAYVGLFGLFGAEYLRLRSRASGDAVAR